MAKGRIETDTMGEIEVPKDRYWGAQTQRSYENFKIGSEHVPIEVIHAFGIIKEAAAEANFELKQLSKEKKDLIVAAAKEVHLGNLDEHFPLHVWQTGSGTQTNMNVNEVIANVAIAKTGGKLGSKKPIHPNDDVNMSQSSNDTFPAAMHIASYQLVKHVLIPHVEALKLCCMKKSKEFHEVIKVGRTHLMDAAPVTLGQEFSGYAAQLEEALDQIAYTLEKIALLPLGGTAVGTGLNTPKGFDHTVCKHISRITGEGYSPAPNKFAQISANDSLVSLSGALKQLATVYLKIGNDIRLSGSGPRAGIAELILPANEPGSSIMPGKVNPTQCEAMTMVAIHVMGNDLAFSLGASQGQFQLNTYRPMMIYNLIQSIHLLADGAHNFRMKCLEGIKPNTKNIQKHLEHSLMLATALNKEIGYDQASKIVKKAAQDGISLKEAAKSLKILSEEKFDQMIDPKKMI